jgi:hypothetical protein
MQKEGEFQIQLGVEHHQVGQSMVTAKKFWKKNGFKAHAGEAETTAQGGTSGGAWVAIAARLANFPFAAQRPASSRSRWAAAIYRAGKIDILFVAAYFFTGQDQATNDKNRKLIHEVGSHIATARGLFVLAADWNMEQAEVEESGIHNYLGGCFHKPWNSSYTCGQGNQRTIDFVLASRVLGHIKVTADLGAPWSPHLGLIIEIPAALQIPDVVIMKCPIEIPAAQGPSSASWDHFRRQAERHSDIGLQGTKGTITNEFAIFSRTYELVLLDKTVGIATEKATGRGLVAQFKTAPAKAPSRKGDFFTCANTCFWSSLAVRIKESIHFAKGSRQREPAEFHHWEWISSRGPELHHHLGEDSLSIEMKGKIGEMAKDLQGKPSLARVRWMQCLAHRMAVHFEATAANKKFGQFQEWIKNSLDQNQKSINRYANEDNRPGELPEHVVSEGETICTPIGMMKYRSKHWQQYWNPSGGNTARDIPAWLRDLQKEVRGEEEETYTQDQVMAAIKRADPRAAKGADNWRPKEWDQLPPEGCQMITDIVNQSIHELDLLKQAKLQIVVLLGKDGDPQGRPITLTAGIYRLIGMVQKPGLGSWEDEHCRTAWWDSAVKKSSALRAAVLRETMNEIALAKSETVVEILFDMAKFYDTLSPEKVAKAARKLGFPPRSLVMGMIAHTSPRRIKAGGCFSDEIHPEVSIIAGCTRSVAWSRCILFETLQKLHDDYRPMVCQTWVDDMSARVQGAKSLAIHQGVAGAVFLIKNLTALGMKISTKSTILGSNSEVRDKVQQVIEQRTGLTLKTAERARDLGVDATVARKRSIKTQKDRLKKAATRTKKLGGIIRVLKSARKLVWTTARMQAAWGHQAHGMAPTEVEKLRKSLLKATGFRKAGGCATLVFMLHLPGKDPLQTIPIELISTWTEIAAKLDPSDMERAWVHNVSRLKKAGHRRWNKVFGHMAAVAATLQDKGWDATAANLWRDPEGQQWSIDYNDKYIKPQLVETFKKTVIAQLWERASKAFLGGGLEGGGDLIIARKHIKKLHKEGLHQTAGALSSAAQGAIWPPDRRAMMTNGLHDGRCDYCGKEGADAKHQFWECTGYSDPEINRSLKKLRIIADEARAGADTFPAFWLRGIPPCSWTWEKMEEAAPEAKIWTWGDFEHDGIMPLPIGALAGSDGSGGKHGRDPRTRRAGWGLIIVNKHMFPIGFAMGGTQGGQSVARAELWAAVTFVERTNGPATIFIDASYVVKGWGAGSGKTHAHHHDLWHRLWARLEHRDGEIKVVKIKAHQGEQTAAKVGADLRPTILNEWADQLAGEAAARHEIGSIGIGYLRQIDDTTWKIQRRIAEVTKFIAENPPTAPTPEEKKALAMARRAVQRDSYYKAFRATSHMVERVAGGRLRCTVCRTSSTRAKSQRWLWKTCLPATLAGAHSSHKLQLHQGLTFCSNCGRWGARRIAKLGEVCPGQPVGAGPAALAALALGKKPQGLQEWPELATKPAAQPAAGGPSSAPPVPAWKVAMLARLSTRGSETQGQRPTTKQEPRSHGASSSHEAIGEHSPKAGERIPDGPAGTGVSSNPEALREHSPKVGERIPEGPRASAATGAPASSSHEAGREHSPNTGERIPDGPMDEEAMSQDTWLDEPPVDATWQ